MGLREEIIKKITCCKVRDFENIIFEPNTMYIRENSTSKLKYGYETILEIILVLKDNTDEVFNQLKNEIGINGQFGVYEVYLIDYFAETPVLALDKYLTQKITLKVIWR